MDTKSKSWKAVFSFLCFSLGGLLLLASIAIGLVGVRDWTAVCDALQSDYQNTQRFERHIENVTRTLLTAAREEGPWDSESIRDPNLRWQVWVGREVGHSEPRLWLLNGPPEGYGFYLHYNGTAVTVTKDGKEIDATPFFQVPREGGPRIDIYLAVPEKLVRYEEISPLYALAQNQQAERQTVFQLCAIPAAGLVLFAAYLLLRKHKKRADMALACVTGRIWAEVKILSFPALYWVAICLVPGMLKRPWWTRNLAMQVLAAGGVLLVLGYLAINGLRYTPRHRFWKNSLWGKLLVLWRCEELKRPVERRLQRRAVMVFVAMLPLAFMSMLWGVFDLSRWAWHETTDRQGIFIFVLWALLGLFCLLAQGYFLWQSMADAHLVNEGMEEAIAQRMRSERMKVELITNVSHDLKTPLTSIISYAELLRQEEGLPDHVRDYIQILNDKAQRLKTMVQEVFEVSKAATGDLPLHLERIDLCKLMKQTLADMADPISESGLTLREQLTAEEVPVRADGERMYRVFQNLIQNALQYALEGSRIYVTLEVGDGSARAVIRNTSKRELPAELDLTARFVRGDESRTDGGSGLGLSIASTFTAACGGAFRVDTDADLFTATVEFPMET